MKEYCGEIFSKLELAGEELSGLLLEDCLFQSCPFYRAFPGELPVFRLPFCGLQGGGPQAAGLPDVLLRF